MHRFLKLHHHRHTGKVLHHRHTSYRALLLIFVLAGLCMFGTNEVAKAEDLVISATVPATIPAEPAVLTSPSDGTIITVPSVTLNGTCPVVSPAVIVQLLEDAQMLASGACDENGEFVITATLSEGRHALLLSILTVTNGIGEQSGIFHITYTPPVQPNNETPAPNSGSSTGTNPGGTPTTPLLIVAEQPYIVFGQYNPAIWQGRFAGGTPFYSVSINWGDDTIETKENIGTELQQIPHTYKLRGPFTAIVTVTDLIGLTYQSSFAAISMGDFVSAGTSSSFGSGPGLSEKTLYNITIYGSYSAALLTMLLLWRIEHFHTVYIAASHFYSPSRIRALRHLHHKGT